jgi:hypothetical protein
LIDTGASISAVDGTILARLGLAPTGVVQIHTPSTQGVPHPVNQYDVSLVIFGATNTTVVHAIPAIPVMDGNYQAQGIDGLLGRDVLANSHMFYAGDVQWFTLSF